jgi:hypothetical protein
MSTDRWPALREQDRWLVRAMEDQLLESMRSPYELRSRASELRAEAKQSDINGIREASLALAEHYEAAAARLGTH